MRAPPLQLEELLRKFNVSRESLQRLEHYVVLLERWQNRINLIGASTLADVWQRHIADAVQLMPFLPASVERGLDLGSGAGIPGLVLAITTNTQFDLIESNGKKAAFLRIASQETGANTCVHTERIEAVTLETLPHVVTARALAPLTRLLELASPFMQAGAVGLFHKGQDVEQELTEASKYWSFTVTTHPSLIDSRGVILAVKDVSRVAA